jgi:hypothetical protein
MFSLFMPRFLSDLFQNYQQHGEIEETENDGNENALSSK